jgi:hypothetical protein
LRFPPREPHLPSSMCIATNCSWGNRRHPINPIFDDKH